MCVCVCDYTGDQQESLKSCQQLNLCCDAMSSSLSICPQREDVLGSLLLRDPSLHHISTLGYFFFFSAKMMWASTFDLILFIHPKYN